MLSQWRRVVRVFSALALTGAAAHPVAAQDSIPSLMNRTGTIRSSALREVSGVAVSRRHPGVLWTHNDSGGKAFIYAISISGDVLGTYAVPGARATDWEDIALGPCPGDDSPCLYIADTGDNSEKRKTVSIYIVPEPAVLVHSDTARTEPAREIRIRYPDGGHDVEAVFVDHERTIRLFSKGWSRAVVQYAVTLENFARDTARAMLVDTLPIVPLRTLGRLVTGAALSPSGRRVVLRTYSELYFFTLSPSGELRPEGVPCWLGAAEPQGEGVDFLDERTVVLVSESLAGQDGPIYEVSCSRNSD